MVTLEHLGTYWPEWGDLFWLTGPDKTVARVYVDSLGEVWVDIRRIPEDGYFHTERVQAFRADSVAAAELGLHERGFHSKVVAHGAHRVRERRGGLGPVVAD